MSTSRWIGHRFVWTLAVLTIGLRTGPAAAQQAEDADSAAAEGVVVSDAPSADSEADPFAVPEGSPAELLKFIEGLAHHEQPFTSHEELREYLDQVSTAIAAAADEIFAAEATDQQTIDAIEWKVESLRIRGQLGDREAEAKTDELLAGFAADSRPAVADAVAQIRGYRREMQFVKKWGAKLRRMPGLDAPQRAELIGQFVEQVKSGEVFANQVVLSVHLCDFIADTNDTAPAAAAVNELLPLFRASGDPNLVARIPLLEGIARRLNLPGNQLELEGTFVDGSTLDWSEYRGKVVLVDFWATGCGPCLAEVPNVLENYRKYHDKGFDVLGISLDVDRGDVERVMQEANIPWRSLFHPASEEGGWYHPMASMYGVIGIPRAILVDQQGSVVHMNARGPMLGAELERLLGEPAVDATSAVQSPDEKKTALSEPR